MHMDTKFGCHPPMSTNGVDVSVEESDSDEELNKKTPYVNFFPMSCYQNIQFKESRRDHLKPQTVSDAATASTNKTVEVDVINTLSQHVSSPLSASHCYSNTTITVGTASTADVTVNTSSVISVATSDVLAPVGETALSKTASTIAESPTTVSSELAAHQVVPSTANSSSSQSTIATSSVSTSLSSDHTDRPVSTNDSPVLTDEISSRMSNSNTKVESTVIEVTENPLYPRVTFKMRNDSEPVPMVTHNKEVPKVKADSSKSTYDMMEPILKPNTYNSSAFFSAPSSVIDSQTSERVHNSEQIRITEGVHLSTASSTYENVVSTGNGKFTITTPSSCDSENLNFQLDSSFKEQQTSLHRPNSMGSLLPQPTVQNHPTFYSPANDRKGLKQSASLSATPEIVGHQLSDKMSKSATLDANSNYSKIHVRGSTAISKGTVKKKICLFENNTLPSGTKSLADLGIYEDQDSDNGFVV